LCILLGTCLLLAEQAVSGAVTRPRELDADRLAAERFAAPFDHTVADSLNRNGFRHPFPRLLRCFSSHLGHNQRVRASQPAIP
jgi:hypothetical protein